jgi:hypothetical protein
LEPKDELMATFDYILRVTDQTSGTVTLTSSPFQVKEWQLRTGSDDQTSVTETCEVRITDGSVAANLVETRTLQELLQQAKDAQRNRSLDKVYLTWQQTNGGTVYRSEIHDGRVEWESEALQYPQWIGDTQFARVHWERSNWWDAPEVQIPLTNLHGTADTSGLAIYNNANSGTANYVDIAGTAVLGDLPGPTRLELTNSYNSGTALAQIWIGQNVFNPTTFDHWVEGEDASYGGTVVGADYYSGGSVIQTGQISDTEQPIFKWDLTTAISSACGGRVYRLIFRSSPFQTSWNVFRYRLKIAYGAQVVWQTDLVQPENHAMIIQPLFTVRLPPWLPGQSGLDGLTLELWAIETIEAHGNLYVDFFQLTPTDGYREIRRATYNVPYETRVIDDGIQDLLYIDDGAGAAKAGILSGYGAAIKLWPGRDQRLYFLMSGSIAATAELDRTLSAKLYHRPRRRTI